MSNLGDKLSSAFLPHSGQKNPAKAPKNGPKLADHMSSLDALRAAAAISVCLFHFSHDNFLNGGVFQSIFQLGYLGVDAFFVISGFVIPLALYNSRPPWIQEVSAT
ncbi:MAG: acyltransferase [Verrucomicrobia bacterium]|nr:acyltransferase [Verrucomicrobiota bacterium]